MFPKYLNITWYHNTNLCQPGRFLFFCILTWKETLINCTTSCWCLIGTVSCQHKDWYKKMCEWDSSMFCNISFVIIQILWIKISDVKNDSTKRNTGKVVLLRVTEVQLMIYGCEYMEQWMSWRKRWISEQYFKMNVLRKKITWDNCLDLLNLDGLIGAQLLPNPLVLNQKIHWVCCFCQINDCTFHCRPNSFHMACACSHQSVKAWLLLPSVIIKSNVNGEFVSDSKFQDWKRSKWNVHESKNRMKSFSQI